MEKEADPYYKRLARDLTNVLHDKRFLADDLDRESVDRLDAYIAFLFQSHCEIAVRSSELLRRVRDAR